jgi:hypothetical protein
MAQKDARNDLTAEFVRSLLDYDPETGVLTWKQSPRIGWVGKPAGTRRPNGQIAIQIATRGRLYLAHRLIWLIMTGDWPPNQIDHRDLDPSNNRWTNLRLATRSQNCVNRRRKSTNTSGFTGVSKRGNRYRAYVNVRGKREYLGDFATAKAAAAARSARAKELHGEFYSHN